MTVPYLRKEAIEATARQLLSDYGKKYSPVVAPPVDVFAIAESLLRLHLEYDDLEKKHGKGILGAINFEHTTIFINVALDPDENVQKQGRHNFTLTHEIGHWMLHRFEYLAPDVFNPQASGLSILCRTAQKKDPLEWQADQFASHLLMPRLMVQQSWREAHGNLVLSVGNIDGFKRCDDVISTRKDYFLLVKEFAQKFAVSAQAMRIRLADLQFVCRQDE
jgi:Zn-dependent peptidase ImmA (M78 family)